MLLHADHELESNNNFMDIAQPVTGAFDDFVNSGKCFVCTTAIITIISPILISSLPSHLIKKGLLGVVNSLSKACGLSKSKVTEKIMEYDSFTLVDNGAGWFAKNYVHVKIVFIIKAGIYQNTNLNLLLIYLLFLYIHLIHI